MLLYEKLSLSVAGHCVVALLIGPRTAFDPRNGTPSTGWRVFMLSGFFKKEEYSAAISILPKSGNSRSRALRLACGA